MNYDKLLEIRLMVTERINELMEIPDFEFSIDFLKYIHNYLFNGIYDNSGNFRTYNISRPELILDGESVKYLDYNNISNYLNFYFFEENRKKYGNQGVNFVTKNMALFSSRIWQVHPFNDGNTRTIGIFIEKYLQDLGFNVNRNVLKSEFEYYRNALVLSAYYNERLHIHNNYEPLVKFYIKMLFGGDIILDNDSLYLEKLFENRGVKEKVRKNEQYGKK